MGRAASWSWLAGQSAASLRHGKGDCLGYLSIRNSCVYQAYSAAARYPQLQPDKQPSVVSSRNLKLAIAILVHKVECQADSAMQAGLGQMYEKLIAAGTVDERTALMLFLVVEKLRAEVWKFALIV